MHRSVANPYRHPQELNNPTWPCRQSQVEHKKRRTPWRPKSTESRRRHAQQSREPRQQESPAFQMNPKSASSAYRMSGTHSARSLACSIPGYVPERARPAQLSCAGHPGSCEDRVRKGFAAPGGSAGRQTRGTQFHKQDGAAGEAAAEAN